MFGFGKKKTIEVTKLSSLIASNVHVIGDVLFSGGLRVDGKVDGNVMGKRGEKSLIVISEHGCVAGRVAAHDAVINGVVKGDLEVDHFLELQPGAKVSGNISYRQLQMDCGASVEGKLVKVAEQPGSGQVQAQQTSDTPQAARQPDGASPRNAREGAGPSLADALKPRGAQVVHTPLASKSGD